MAKKTKCSTDEMLSWIKLATECEKIQPDPTKLTLAQQRKGVSVVFAEGEGCIPKPKLVGGGAVVKAKGEYYRTAQKTTGKKFKDLW